MEREMRGRKETEKSEWHEKRRKKKEKFNTARITDIIDP